MCSQYQAQALLSGGPVEEPPAQEETVPEPAAPSPEELLRRAIQRGVQVAFQAVTWELSSTGMALRQEEAVTASPWWLYCQDGALWLLATDTATGQARRFPLRQVSQVRLLPQAREGEEFLPAVEKFTLEFPQELLPQVASRFDGALALEHLGKARLRATGKAPLDGEFFGWLFSMGNAVRLTSPKPAAEQLREQAKAVGKAYKS